jgi:hypothetical protein
MLSSNDDGVDARLNASATGLGASSPGLPSLFTVDGARVGVAILLNRQRIAGFSAVSYIGDDGTSARLNTASAKFIASGPASESRENTIDGTRLRATGLELESVRVAFKTAIFGSGNHRASTLLGARGTRPAAGRKCGPSRELAVNGATESVASDSSGKIGATDTVVVLFSDHRTSLGLGTGVARFGAGTKASPARDFAINRASKTVALERRREGGASLATVLHVGENGTSLGLGTHAASLGAGTVCRPGRDLAIDGASLGVANAVLFHRATVTTMFGSHYHLVGAALGTRTTGLRASGPGVPIMLAVHRTRVGVAILFTRYSVARLTTVGLASDDGTRTVLDTTTAELGASTPSIETRKNAVNGASLGFTSGGRRKRRTDDATVGNVCLNRTGPGHGTSAASFGASAVS